jgi:hypothetical protein
VIKIKFFRWTNNILPSTTNGVRVMVFNTTFNNISVISWLSVLLVDYLIVEDKILLSI